MSRRTAATPQTKATAMAPKVVTPRSKTVDPVNRGSSKSPVESKTPDPAASLSARMGNMVLLDKERAWGLDKVARFRDLGKNVFEVHFGSEGDWRHVLHNRPWQFDFSVLIVKEYDGGTRPSEMVFDTVEIWVQVHDLHQDKRTEEFGNALGNWLGKVVRVDVDEEGKAKGQHLRVRPQISVFEPLVRGFFLKSSREGKSKLWFDFHYEKVPHFCFECGRLVHVNGVCAPPVDPSSQWGGWLRASSDKHGGSKGGSQEGGGGSNNSMGSGRQGDSRTGEEYRSGEKDGRSPISSRCIAKEQHEGDLCFNLEQRREEVMRGKLVEQQRQRERVPTDEMSRVERGLRTPPKFFLLMNREGERRVSLHRVMEEQQKGGGGAMLGSRDRNIVQSQRVPQGDRERRIIGRGGGSSFG
ncbi:hypothetical protein D1007_23552 [Hordeum vulgare]|nr:hypothetical protein D1007_23552 [Hordeum vulgare]